MLGCSAPLRGRFGIVHRLDFYEERDIHEIVRRSANILGVEVDDVAGREIARRSRGTPRIANRLLRRVRDYAQVRADGSVTVEVAHAALQLLEVDDRGFDELDRRLLRTIIENSAAVRSASTAWPQRSMRKRRDRGHLRAFLDSGRIPRSHAARPRRDCPRLRILGACVPREGFPFVVTTSASSRAICRARIASVAGYVPPRVLTNADLERMVDTTDDWIMKRVGIRERHVVDAGVATS